MKPSTITAVLGASPKAERISNQAVAELKSHGHKVIPIHPVAEEIQGVRVVKSLSEITVPVDTLTMYVNAARSSALEKEIFAVHPRRVIFNPGAENPELTQKLEAQNIQVENACTLILLHTGQYDT